MRVRGSNTMPAPPPYAPLTHRFDPFADSDVEWNFDGIVIFDKEGVPNSRTSIGSPPTKEQISALM